MTVSVSPELGARLAQAEQRGSLRLTVRNADDIELTAPGEAALARDVGPMTVARARMAVLRRGWAGGRRHVGRAQDSLELSLEVGEQRVISSQGVTSYSQGTPGVIDVRLTKRRSQLRPGRAAPWPHVAAVHDEDGASVNYRIVVTRSATLRRSPRPLRSPTRSRSRRATTSGSTSTSCSSSQDQSVQARHVVAGHVRRRQPWRRRSIC